MHLPSSINRSIHCLRFMFLKYRFKPERPKLIKYITMTIVVTSRRRSTPASSQHRPVVTANAKTLRTRVTREDTRFSAVMRTALTDAIFIYSRLTPHPPHRNKSLHGAPLFPERPVRHARRICCGVDLTMRSRREAGQSPAHPRFYA